MQAASDLAPERRSSFDICADILRVLSEEFECSRSMLAFKSQLDSRGIARYIDIILKHELATLASGNSSNFLRISAKGRAYLEQYAKLVTMLEGISGRIDFGWQVPSQA